MTSQPEFKLADPICTYIFSVLVLFTTFRIIRDTMVIVLEGKSQFLSPFSALFLLLKIGLDILWCCLHPAVVGAPKHLDTVRIREDLLKLEDVQSVDELNVWALTADRTAALVHIQLSE